MMNVFLGLFGLAPAPPYAVAVPLAIYSQEDYHIVPKPYSHKEAAAASVNGKPSRCVHEVF